MRDRLSDLQKDVQKNSTLSILVERLNREARSGAENSPLLSENNDATDMVYSFLLTMTNLNKKLDEMEDILAKIKSLHSEILVEPGVNPSLNTVLDEAVSSFTNYSVETNSIIKALNNNMDGDFDDTNHAIPQSLAAARIHKNQVMTISKRFQDLLLSFNDEQMMYKDRCKQKISSYLTIAGLEMPEEDVEKAIENGTLYDYTRKLMLAERDKQALYDEVKTRHDDIVKLESNIKQLQDLFIDLYTLIQSQDELLNNIELNVQNAVEFAKKAHKNVAEAQKMRKGARNKKICLVIAMIILIILLFVIGTTTFCATAPLFCR